MIRRLLTLNGLAVLGVAINHATGYGFRAMFDMLRRSAIQTGPDLSRAGSLAFYSTVFFQQLIFYTLPAFLFVSGFYLAFTAGKKPGISWDGVLPRIKTLLIPFLLWSLFFFVVLVQRLPSSLDDLFRQYYYIPILIELYLISPLLIPLAKKHPVLLLSLSTIGELGRFSLEYLQALGINSPAIELLRAVTPQWMIPNLLFWFTLGIVAGVHRQKFVELLGRAKWFLLGAAVLLLPLTLIEYVAITRVSGSAWLGPYFGGYSRYLFSLAFLLSFLAFDKARIPFNDQLSYLGSKSLGIYLAHEPVMYVTAVVIFKFLPWMLNNQLLYQGTLIVVAIGVPVAIMHLWSRTPARRVYRYVFG